MIITDVSKNLGQRKFYVFTIFISQPFASTISKTNPELQSEILLLEI